MTCIESGSFIGCSVAGEAGFRGKPEPPLRHGDQDQPLAVVADIGPAGDLVKSAKAAGAEADFHLADIDAG